MCQFFTGGHKGPSLCQVLIKVILFVKKTNRVSLCLLQVTRNWNVLNTYQSNRFMYLLMADSQKHVVYIHD